MRRFVFQSIHKCPSCGKLLQFEGMLEVKKYQIQKAQLRVAPVVVQKPGP